jgi:hypothetical protein
MPNSAYIMEGTTMRCNSKHSQLYYYVVHITGLS